MPKRKFNPPAKVSTLTTYSQLEEILSRFADGALSFAVILGKPGLSKGESTKKALLGKAARIIKGDHSHPMLYCTLYEYQDKPIVFDDTDKLMDQAWFQELLKNLTETNKYKKLEYDKKSPILQERETPVFYWTKSPVLLIMNWWDTNNALCTALESRAEFFTFEPTWYECYRQWSSWFDDQEIYDYIHANLDMLRQPDARLLVKARSRKQAGMQHVTWKQLIDDHIDDHVGKEVRRLLKDRSCASNNARAAKFVEMGFGDRATFYRRMKELILFLPLEAPLPARIILPAKQAIEQERPADGPLPDGSSSIRPTENEDNEGIEGGEADVDIQNMDIHGLAASRVVLNDGHTKPIVCSTLQEAVQRVASWIGPIDNEDIQNIDDLQNRIIAFEDENGLENRLRVMEWNDEVEALVERWDKLQKEIHLKRGQ